MYPRYLSPKNLIFSALVATIAATECIRTASAEESSAIYHDTDVFTVRTSYLMPLGGLDEEDNWQGYEIDVINRLASMSGLTPRFVRDYNWPRSYKSLRYGTFDGLTQVSYHADRVNEIDYLLPLDTEQLVVMVKKSNADVPLNHIDDFIASEHLIGKVQGTRFSEKLENEIAQRPALANKFTSMLPSKSNDPNWYYRRVINDLSTDRLLGVVINRGTFESILKYADGGYHDDDERFKEVTAADFDFIDSPIFGAPVTFLAISKYYSPANKAALINAYCTMHRNDELTELRKKWQLKPHHIPPSAHGFPSPDCAALESSREKS